MKCFILAAIVVLLPLFVDATRPLKSCYLFPYHASDLGFTYINKIAAAEVQRDLQAKYPNVTIRHRVWDRFLLNANITVKVLDIAERENCSMILFCGRDIVDRMNGRFNDVAAQFPDIIFWAFSTPIARSTANAPNVVATAGEPAPSWFVAGAAAAVECTSCIGIMVPTAAQRFVASAFYEGMRVGEAFRSDRANVSQLCPLLGVEIGSFTNPAVEVAFTRSMMIRGCSIVAYFSDSYDGAKYAQQQQSLNASLRRTFTVTGNVNGALVVGDSVLTSVYFNFYATYLKLAESFILREPLKKMTTQPPAIGTVSPLAHLNTTKAISAAVELTRFNSSVVYCAPLRNRQGELLNPNGTGCFRDLFDYTSFFVMNEPVSQLGQFASPTQCLPGTFSSYNDTGDLRLSCLPCPKNTYSTLRGSFECTPCPPWFVSPPNSSMCFAPLSAPAVETSLALALSVGIVVPLLVGILVILLVCLFRNRNVQHQAVCPHPEVVSRAFLIIDVDPSRSRPGWREQLRAASYAFELYFLSVESAVTANSAKVLFRSPTTYFVTAASVEQACAVAEEVERLLGCQKQNTPDALLAIRAVIHFGEVLQIPPPNERLLGPGIERLLAVHREHQARVGEMIMTSSAFGSLKASDASAVSRVTSVFALFPGTPEEMQCYRLIFKTELASNREQPDLRTSCRSDSNGSSSASGISSKQQPKSLSEICGFVLKMFLGVLSFDQQNRAALLLKQRLRIYLPDDLSTPKEVVGWICDRISVDLCASFPVKRISSVKKELEESFLVREPRSRPRHMSSLTAQRSF
jgi:hypothetical protein